MTTQPDLESLYNEAQAALKRREYDRAAGLLKQILLEDENYKDASRLLAQAVRLKRRKWYNDMRLWGIVIGLVVISLLVWLVPKIHFSAIFTPPTSTTPTVALTATKTIIPTETIVPTATAAPMAWKRISMGLEFPRLQITSIAFDPVDPDVIYVGTQSMGLYKTINGGESWQASNSDILLTEVNKIIINPQDPRIILVQAKQELYRSIDGGGTWEKSLSESDLIVDVLDPSILYAQNNNDWSISRSVDHGASWKIFSFFNRQLLLVIGDTWFLMAPNGWIETSENAGRTWTEISNLNITNLYYQKNRQGREYLIARGSIWKVYRSGQLVNFSLDEGKHWQIIGESGCLLTAPNAAYSALYSICGGILKKTSDGGQNWDSISAVQDRPTALAISPLSESILAIAGEKGLEISRDGGRSWKAANNGIGNVSMELSSNHKNHSTWYAKALIVANNQANSDICRFYRSTDAGYTWQVLRNDDQGCNLALDGFGNLYQTEKDLIIRSADNGDTWQDFPRPAQFATADHGWWIIPHPYREDTFFASAVFIGTHNTMKNFILFSSDAGNTWEKIGGDLSNVNVQFGFSSDPNIIYFTLKSLVFNAFEVSSDGGATRQKGTAPWNFETIVNKLLVDPRNSERVFAATNNEGIFVSEDGGRLSWENRSAGLLSRTVNTLAMDPNNPTILYAGTDGGAYVSFDGGETWGEINDGLLGELVVYSIVVDKDSHVYAATPYGIFELGNR